MVSKQVPLGRALLWILLWTCLISGTGTGGWLLWRYFQQTRRASSHYFITQIAQPGPLSTNTLAELLGLSVDMPVNLHALDLCAARRSLERAPFIDRASVVRLSPNTLQVDYDVVQPIARCGSQGIASDGTYVPLEPYFISSGLPRLIGDDMVGLALIQTSTLPIEIVDVSRTHAPSAGRREIVVTLPGVLLRLPVYGWEDALARYEKLCERVVPNYGLASEQTLIVDLRLDQLAYLSHATDSDSLDHG